MRRSKSIALLFMATAPFALTACDDSAKKPTPVGSFHDQADCRASGEFSEEQCQAAIRTAAEQHESRAPRYQSREECEAAHGAEACVPREQAGTGQSFFMPMMMGFMVGRMLSGGGMMGAPLYGSAASPASYRTAQGEPIRQGVATMPASAAASTMQSASQPARTAPAFSNVQRGGLGTRAESGTMGPTGRGATSSAGESSAGG
jgi:uncharacterized protein YgiB involved in biofilm formation